MATIFSKIISGEISCYKIAEDEKHLAFLDINPLTMGHTLVIPKHEIDYIFDMDNASISDLHIFAKQVSIKIKKAIKCKKIGMAIIGLEVPHAHIHLIPINNVNDMNFANTKLKPTSDELTNIVKMINS
ncbi:MAG: hypothetical protein RL065_1676 [Bacteroidota bacterium]|jgi:histidine triad (HIT) family protein